MSQESWDINTVGKVDLASFGKRLSRKVAVGTKKNLRNNCMISLSKRQTAMPVNFSIELN